MVYVIKTYTSFFMVCMLYRKKSLTSQDSFSTLLCSYFFSRCNSGFFFFLHIIKCTVYAIATELLVWYPHQHGSSPAAFKHRCFIFNIWGYENVCRVAYLIWLNWLLFLQVIGKAADKSGASSLGGGSSSKWTSCCH